jgi:hypothetical protein
MSLKEAAAREAYLKTLLDVVNDGYKEARAETQDALDAVAQETGTRQVAVALPDGTDIATVSLSSGEAAAKVIDEDEFTKWVVANYSSEITRRFVTEVQPAFAKKLLAEMTASGSAEWADPETGVIHEVPGVAIAPARARTHSVRFKKDGREQVMQAWRDGQLVGTALPALTAGASEPAVEVNEAATLRARIAELEKRDAWLSALEAAGVDNWQGIEVAHEMHNGGAE